MHAAGSECIRGMIDAVYHWNYYALVLIFGGKVVVKKVGKVAKKAVKIIILCYAYMFYMGLIANWFADISGFLTAIFCLLPVAIWFIRRRFTFKSRVDQQIKDYFDSAWKTDSHSY